MKMKYLKSWKIFEFKETESNTPVLYKDDNLEVKVVKTFDACKEQGKDTRWCSNLSYGFYKHNITANMYRFNFKDGYKLRLTWDHIDYKASPDKFAGGTHWGSGGIVDGKEIKYEHIRPEDESEPFLFDYNKGDQRQEMINRVNSIPQEAIDAVHDYQDKSSKEKSALVGNLFNEVSKIKVMDVEIINDEDYPLLIKINYNSNTYKLKMDQYGSLKYSKDFQRDFKNKYAFADDYGALSNHLIDKVNSILKSKKVNESLKIFESSSNIKQLIEDALLDLTDDDIPVKVRTSDDFEFIDIEIGLHYQFNDQSQDRTYKKYFDITKYFHCFELLNNILKSEGYKEIMVNVYLRRKKAQLGKSNSTFDKDFKSIDNLLNTDSVTSKGFYLFSQYFDWVDWEVSPIYIDLEKK